MSDIGIFSPEDMWILTGLAIGSLLWPIAAAAVVWRKVGVVWAGLTWIASIVLLYLLALVLDLRNADTAWPIIITWTVVPPVCAAAAIAWARRGKPHKEQN